MDDTLAQGISVDGVLLPPNSTVPFPVTIRHASPSDAGGEPALPILDRCGSMRRDGWTIQNAGDGLEGVKNRPPLSRKVAL